MRKLIGVLAGLCLCGSAFADSYTYTLTVTNAQPITYSAALPVSGWLDRIEVRQDTATSTVTVATYDGTAVVETFASKVGIIGNKVFRPRKIGTDTFGTNLAHVITGGTASNVTTVINIETERMMLGGNVKVAITGTANDGSNPVDVTLFYEPTKK